MDKLKFFALKVVDIGTTLVIECPVCQGEGHLYSYETGHYICYKCKGIGMLQILKEKIPLVDDICKEGVKKNG